MNNQKIWIIAAGKEHHNGRRNLPLRHLVHLESPSQFRLDFT